MTSRVPSYHVVPLSLNGNGLGAAEADDDEKQREISEGAHDAL